MVHFPKGENVSSYLNLCLRQCEWAAPSLDMSSSYSDVKRAKVEAFTAPHGRDLFHWACDRFH